MKRLLVVGIAALCAFAASATPLSIRKFEVDRSYSLPAKVQAGIQNAPLVYGHAITGTSYSPSYVLKVDTLLISKRSRLVFKIDVEKPLPEFIALVANQVYIEGPQSDADVSIITYEVAGSIDGAPGAEGVSGDKFPRDNPNGKDGTAGQRGINGRTVNLPPLYIVIGGAEVRGGNPASSSLLNVFFNGVRGGNGGNGGQGGKGGDGARGADAQCHKYLNGLIERCDAGPQRGGDTGRPGAGGQGGDGAPGGNGADIHYFGPGSVQKILGFFIPYNDPGSPGYGGGGGRCGPIGQFGGSGSKNCCDQGREHGDTMYCTAKEPFDPGADSKVQGVRGAFSITERAVDDLIGKGN